MDCVGKKTMVWMRCRFVAMCMIYALFLNVASVYAGGLSAAIQLDGWTGTTETESLYTIYDRMECSYTVSGTGTVNIYVAIALNRTVLMFLTEEGGISFEMIPYRKNVVLTGGTVGETVFDSLLPASLMSVPCWWGVGVEYANVTDSQFTYALADWRMVDHVELPTHTATLDLPSGAYALDLKLLPTGSFLMGSPDSDGDAERDEKPQHWVHVERPFYMAVSEITQAQWTAIFNSNPAYRQGINLPVTQVTWEEATAYADWLNSYDHNRPSGYAYRLPTEAEWEYACRAGSSERFSFGDDPNGLDDYAWYSENADDHPHEVGSRLPNAWGLYDMHGNVAEWCFDWYDSIFYSYAPSTQPHGPDSGSTMAVRGGCYENRKSCRSASRDDLDPLTYDKRVGFRVVLAPVY